MKKYISIIFAVILSSFFGITVHAETRGTGPFVAKVCKAEDDTLYLLDGFQPYSLQQSDQKAISLFIGKFIQFECDMSQMGMPYTGLKKIREISYSDKFEDIQVAIEFENKFYKYGEPVYFTIDLYTKHEGGYGVNTPSMRAAVWNKRQSIPIITRSFRINRLWGEGFEMKSGIIAHTNQHSRYKFSINVLLDPGEYSLVIEQRVPQYDELTEKWSESDVLLAEPVPFSIINDENSEDVKQRLYSWLNSGPAEERPRAAKKLVSMREGENVYKKVLDDLDTDVFDIGGKCDAIQFVSQNPIQETASVLRTIILRQKNDIGIENVLSCIPTNNTPDKRHKILTEMLMELLRETRFVEAQHSSMSHIRVCDCIAAWLQATTSGSGYFANKSIEERDKIISEIVKRAISENTSENN